MKEITEKLNAFIDSKKEEIFATWADIINLESYYDDVEGLAVLADRLKAEFEAEGFQCRLIPVGEGRGQVLSGILGADRPGKPILFSGHMDTVFPRGKFGENPFHIEDGKAYGPGVLDMKGGIVISLYVVKALNQLGYTAHPIKILFCGDEETLHENAKTAEVLMEEGKGCLCAFNMETGIPDGSICISRKGKTEVAISVEGVSAHAGNDFTSGRNAIVEMCKKLDEIQALTNFEVGTTVNVGTIHGGTMSGAVPAHCEAKIDLRATKVSEMEKVKKQVEEICAKTFIEGTTTSFRYTMEMLPYETNDAVLKLYQFVHDTAAAYGFGDLPSIKLGGSSDASYLTIAGTPAICSCGVRGQWNHTDKEYAFADSMLERAKLWATVVLELDKFQ